MFITFVLIIILAIVLTGLYNHYEAFYFQAKSKETMNISSMIDEVLNCQHKHMLDSNAEASHSMILYSRKLNEHWKQRPNKTHMSSRKDYQKYAIMNRRF